MMNSVPSAVLRSAALAVLLPVLGAFAAPVAAGAVFESGGGHVTELAQANGVSLDQAVAQVQRRTGGRVLSAETRMENGEPVHHIRVLTDNNRVRTIRVHGETGAWL